MKPAPFGYVRPAEVGDAVAELVRADQEGGGKVLAGGQSLMPVLAMRLGRPATLVDITRIAELQQVQVADGELRIGAAVRQRRIERDFGGVVPLLSRALPWIGHREIRSRGTVCGSLAHADPSSELPAVATCLGATLDVIGPYGKRSVPAAEFFTAAMTTVLAPVELVASVRVPLPSSGSGFGFAEVARRHGDFALAGVAVSVTSREGVPRSAVVTAFGVSDKPQRRDLTRQVVAAVNAVGPAPEALTSQLVAATEELADEVVTTEGDSSGSPAYRRRLISALGARELARAFNSSMERSTR
ncbi:FAD binding domain-containing protein [Flexivirga oryzae]|uniref:Carbon-monoxide dehydrogenase medium subunit n=1 Tax=Flexivirga oryzae TaxID=1794944 RepID=A0A839N8R3_9MICO|nr:FAD binding domain-containing protein [Flexivirga oryzae]MBB2891042.1 carbon-monoxide dehydrogenase medium subunit [Flexivirga oryzae]